MINKKVSGLSLFFNQINKVNDLERACKDLDANFGFVGGGNFIFFKRENYYLIGIDDSKIERVFQKNEFSSKIYEIGKDEIYLGTSFGNYIIRF